MSTAPLLPGFPQPEPPPFEHWIAFPIRAITDPTITDLDRRVLALIVHFTGRRIDFTTAPNEELAKTLGIDKASLRRCLIRLEAAGYLRRHRDRFAGSAHRRIELGFRTWDPPKTAEQASTGSAPAHAHCTSGRSAPAHAKECASARQGVRQRTPSSILVFRKEEKSSNGDGAPAQGEKSTEEVTPQTCGGERAAARDQAEPEAPPTPEEVARWHQWIREGQPNLVRIARAALEEAGLPVPEPPPRPAESVPSDTAEDLGEHTGSQLAAPEAARTAQDAPGTPRGEREAQSIQEPARAQSEPRQAVPPRPPKGDLPELAAVNWSAMMQRCAQLGASRGPKARTLVGEDLLRDWVETGDPRQLEGVLNAWSAHWRDWQRISRDHWRGCLEEIRTGLISVEEVLGVLDDAERRGIEKRANYFSHHLGDALRLRREAQKTTPPGQS